MATFGDRIEALGEAVDMLSFSVPGLSIFSFLIKILQSTGPLVVFFVGNLGCPFPYW